MNQIAKGIATLGLAALMFGLVGQTVAKADGNDWRGNRDQHIQRDLRHDEQHPYQIREREEQREREARRQEVFRNRDYHASRAAKCR